METLYVDPIVYTGGVLPVTADRLRLYDSTLRDGEQMPGVAFSPEQKLMLAREIAGIGCHVIEVGFPAASEGERRALQLVLQARAAGFIRRDVEIVVMCRCLEDDIRTTIDCIRQAGFDPGSVTLLLFTSASGLHCRHKLARTLLPRAEANGTRIDDIPLEVFHTANRQLVDSAIRFAVEQGATSIDFGAEDASRTPVEDLIALVQVAVDAGATRYVFADTTGCLTPEATAHYCGALARAFPRLALASHFHNDFDLAVANVITSVKFGFNTISVTVNGLGERAGNAPLHSTVMALRLLYGVEIPGFEYRDLCRLKRVVERASGVPIQAHEPVIGHNAFAHESGVHVHGVSIDRRLYEAIPYVSVGGDPRRVFGKHSGVTAVLDTLEKNRAEVAGEVTRERAEEVLAAIKSARELRASTIDYGQWMDDYYSHLNRLGLSEQDVLRYARYPAVARTAETEEARVAVRS